MAQRRRKYLKVVNVFVLCRYYLPYKLGVILHLKIVESLLPKDAFVLSLVEIDPVVNSGENHKNVKCLGRERQRRRTADFGSGEPKTARKS